ncbi:hypothetical protein SNEBB_001332 [Seison nebaliae]|nr:hypothetical protein SNEBB_001332 [Seison nebaliae]
MKDNSEDREMSHYVTKDNFPKYFRKFSKDLDKCDFISFDLELSGILKNESRFNLPKDNFRSMLKFCRNYRIIQFGMTLWMDNDSTTYDFPISFSTTNNDQFSCLSSCINFLSKQNFDFNKMFRDSIPFSKMKVDGDIDESSSDEEDENVEVNFTKILSKIRFSEKLMVGHNVKSDVFAILNQFCENIPTDWPSYKQHCCNFFAGGLVDTKVLAFTYLPHVMIGTRHENTSDLLHDAAFDSFATGLIYKHFQRKNLKNFENNLFKIANLCSVDLKIIDLKQEQNEYLPRPYMYIVSKKDKSNDDFIISKINSLFQTDMKSGSVICSQVNKELILVCLRDVKKIEVVDKYLYKEKSRYKIQRWNDVYNEALPITSVVEDVVEKSENE